MPYAYDIFWKTYFRMSTTCSRSSFAFHIFGNWNNPTNGFKITFAVNLTILIMRGRSFLGPKTSSMSILKINYGIFFENHSLVVILLVYEFSRASLKSGMVWVVAGCMADDEPVMGLGLAVTVSVFTCKIGNVSPEFSRALLCGSGGGHIVWKRKII